MRRIKDIDSIQQGIMINLIKGILGKRSKGIVGGYNLNEFKKGLTDIGIALSFCMA